MILRPRNSRLVYVASGLVLAGLTLPVATVAQTTAPPAVDGQLGSLGADVVLETDAYGGDPSSTSISGAGSVIQKEGVLELKPRDRGQPLTHRRSLETTPAVIRIEADVVIGPDSRAGLLCESDALDRTFSVGMLFGQGVLIGRFDADDWSEGARAAHGQPFWPDAHFAVECAVVPGGHEHVAIWLDGQLALEHIFDQAIGPFGSVSLSAETIEPGEPMSFTGVDIGAGEAYAPTFEGGPMTVVLADTFDDETLGEPYDDEGRRVAYLDGELQTYVAELGSSVWSWRDVEEASSMRVEADVSVETSGVAGIMCGDEASGTFIVGAVISSGDVALGRLVDGDIEVVEFLALPTGTSITAGVPALLTLDCLARGGGDGARLYVDGTLASTTWPAEAVGPFNAAGIYGESTNEPSDARFDGFGVSIEI